MNRPNPEELDQRLAEHAAWIDSSGSVGRRLRGPLHLGGRDLGGRDLRGVDLAGSELTRAVLDGADLGPAVVGTRSVVADLRGALCREASFAGARLDSSDLRGCDLGGAVFSEDARIESSQLAGANLSGAALPHLLDLRRPFEAVDEAARSARSLVLSMLAACAYTLVAVASSIDAQLFSSSASFRLPVIDLHIAARPFFGWSAVLILVLFLYLQLSVRRLWEKAARLPAVLRDGTPVSSVTSLWLFTTAPERIAARWGRGRPSRFQTLADTAVLWGLPLLTILVLWGRYLARRDPVLTTLHVLCFALLCAVSAASLATRRELFVVAPGVARLPRPFTSASAFLLAAGLLLATTWAVRDGEPLDGLDRLASSTGVSTALASALHLLGASPAANLSGESLTRDVGSEDFAVDDVQGRALLTLRDQDLRFARLRDATAIRVDFRGADLRSADLSNADLRGAYFDEHTRLAGCDLRRADLRYANLAGADLREVVLDAETRFDRANLTEVDLRGQDLSHVSLRGADLIRARLDGAVLAHANLVEAQLEGAKLGHADLSSAKLDEAGLFSADLSHATGPNAALIDAKLLFADARGAELRHSNLANAELQGADLREADLSGANLEGVRFDTDSQLEGAIVDGMRYLARQIDRLPPGVDRSRLKLIGDGEDRGEVDAMIASFLEDDYREHVECSDVPDEAERLLCERLGGGPR